MFLIVVGHTSIIARNASIPSDGVSFWSQTIQDYVGTFGNSVFFAISGYFAAKNVMKPKRIFKVLGVTLFYSVFVILLDLLAKNPQHMFAGNGIAFRVYHVLVDGAWFIPAWIFIMLVAYFTLKPFLKLKLYQQILVIVPMMFLPAIFLIIPMRFNFENIPGNICYYIPLFFFAAILYNLNRKQRFMVLPIFLALCWLRYIFQYPLQGHDHFQIVAIGFLYNAVYTIALLALVLFARLNFRSKIINTVASATLGIYVLHYAIIPLIGGYQPFCWINDWLTSSTGHSPLVAFLIWFRYAAVIFILSMLIELRRQAAYTNIKKWVLSKLRILYK